MLYCIVERYRHHEEYSAMVRVRSPSSWISKPVGVCNSWKDGGCHIISSGPYNIQDVTVAKLLMRSSGNWIERTPEITLWSLKRTKFATGVGEIRLSPCFRVHSIFVTVSSQVRFSILVNPRCEAVKRYRAEGKKSLVVQCVGKLGMQPKDKCWLGVLCETETQPSSRLRNR